MVGVALAYIFGAKITNYEGKQDRSPFVAPQTRGSGSFILVVLEKECLQEVICEASGMRETIDAIADFEIHPALVYVFLEVICVD